MSEKYFHLSSSQSLRLHFLGKEAVVADPQGFVAGGHAARGSGGDLTYSRHCDTSHHCRHPDLYGPQGKDLKFAALSCPLCDEMDPVTF